MPAVLPLSLAAALLLLPSIAPTAQATRAALPALAGSYEATRVNRRTVPTADRVEASPGYEHAVRLEQLVLTLRADRRFTAMVKYHQSLVKRNARPEPTPVMSASVRGRYEVRGSAIHFFPDPDGRGRRVKPVVGTVSGRRISVPFDYRSGSMSRRFLVDFDRNESIW
jgi:hypothetical protein